MASLAREYFSDFVHVNVGPDEISANKNVNQKFEFIPPLQKLNTLVDIIKKNQEKKILVFCNTKRTVSDVYNHIRDQGVKCGEIHGDKMQTNRESTINSLKKGYFNVVVATDLAARGLDIKNIGIVINFDFPISIENYVHRIGRTGRAGNTGDSITFFTPLDGQFAYEVINTIKLSGQPVPEQLQILSRTWANDPHNSRNYSNRNSNKNILQNVIGLSKYANHKLNQRQYNNQNKSSNNQNRFSNNNNQNNSSNNNNNQNKKGGNVEKYKFD